MAARRERGLFDPDTAEGECPFDHHVYVFASDGDIEEGITHEASSIAGVQELGNLIVLYDDNHISIEDDTIIAKDEDIAARYEAYGWHVQRVSWDTPTAATTRTSRPCTTRSRRPRPRPPARRSSRCARSSAGPPRTSRAPARRTARPWATPRWPRPRRSSASTRTSTSRSTRTWSTTPARSSSAARQAHAEWAEGFGAWAGANADRKALFDRMASRTLPGRLGRGAAGVQAGRQGRGHPQGLR